MTDEKQQNLELIEVYRSLPALWDINCEEYSDRNIKKEQYSILLECFNKYNPEGQLSDLKRKINSLRTAYRRELRRIVSFERNEAGINGTYTTTLYYFDALSFLEDVISPAEPTSNFKSEDTTKPEKRKKRLSDEDFYLESCPLQLENTTKPERRKKRLSDEEFLLESDPLQVGGDENRHLIKVWAEKLSKLDTTQKKLAEKVVNEVFLKGQLGLLSLNTTLTETFKQKPLNKHEFTEALKQCIEIDDESVDKLHETYLNLKHINKPVKQN